jgi:hypothetical protein
VVSPGTSVSSINKADSQGIAEILLNVALNTINQPNHQRFLVKLIVVKNTAEILST